MNLEWLFGRLRSLALPLLVFVSLLSLTGCGAANLLGSAGKGVGVNANVQAGKNNTQTVGTTKVVSPQVTLRPKARVDRIDQSTTEQRNENVENLTINEMPLWVILVLVLVCGLIIPSPFKFKGFKSNGSNSTNN